MLFAVHIADGILSPWWLLGGFVILAVMLTAGLWRMREEEVARTGVLTAVLFIATLIHPPLPLPGMRVHLLLNGIAGILIGIRAGAAIPLALLLQALLFSHGGLTTLGVNGATMGIPALLAGGLFATLRRLVGLETRWKRLLIGGLVGFVATFLTCVLYYLALRYGPIDDQDLHLLASVAFVFHIPVIILEALLASLLVDFLYKVKPELLGMRIKPAEIPPPVPLPTGQSPTSPAPRP